MRGYKLESNSSFVHNPREGTSPLLHTASASDLESLPSQTSTALPTVMTKGVAMVLPACAADAEKRQREPSDHIASVTQ